MILRPATLADAPALAQLGSSSFCATFEHLYRPEDLSAFLEQVYSESAVAEEIAGPECIHRLADEAGELIGYCKMRHPSWYVEHSDARNPIALGQLYTAPGRTGEGIGAALMDWALDYARAQGCDAIQLSVFSENFGAQRFYQRYGFGKIADITFEVGQHVDHEFLYELRL
ncbi:GNAT family N-acetyltransferase [Porphyrobacter sp. AAP60]|uniref:GNAT family N-acetyltransferase n=1 Tax=Porphyrobacter sp. AAP60 TaxID=1523423 RepID=UPI0006B8B596|nr:GNAT family N-acetyltransferase [Porphyrobacter sp. AAP60]KPF64680.1 acetyltransferase [Porphyrobacter sp. AAP60]